MVVVRAMMVPPAARAEVVAFLGSFRLPCLSIRLPRWDSAGYSQGWLRTRHGLSNVHGVTMSKRSSQGNIMRWGVKGGMGRRDERQKKHREEQRNQNTHLHTCPVAGFPSKHLNFLFLQK